MTYFELLSKANRLLDKGDITIGQRDEMTKPLWDEIRPKGKWVYEHGKVNSLFRCSNCGRFYPYDTFVKENDVRYTRLEREDANRFCWHCGADMRGGAE